MVSACSLPGENGRHRLDCGFRGCGRRFFAVVVYRRHAWRFLRILDEHPVSRRRFQPGRLFFGGDGGGIFRGGPCPHDCHPGVNRDDGQLLYCCTPYERHGHGHLYLPAHL